MHGTVTNSASNVYTHTYLCTCMCTYSCHMQLYMPESRHLEYFRKAERAHKLASVAALWEGEMVKRQNHFCPIFIFFKKITFTDV